MNWGELGLIAFFVFVAFLVMYVAKHQGDNDDR